MSQTVSTYIVQRLEQAGAKTAFLVSGGMMMHLLDAVGRARELRYFCNHHEQASAMAADAFARCTRTLGVCLATAGPGATNLLTGIVGAWQDSSPVLFITGQCKLAHTTHASKIPNLRQFGMCEVDIVPIVRPVTKYAAVLDDPLQVRYHLEKAIHLATTGRPGPVLLDIPLDIQGAPVEPESLVAFEDPAPIPAIDLARVQSIIARLIAAKRPLIIAGNGIGCGRAVELFNAFIRRFRLPVVVTQLAKDIIEYEDPLYVGIPGVRGDRPGNFAVANADLILTLGCSLHVLTTGFESELFAPNAHKIMLDPDPAMLERERGGVKEKHLCDIPWFIQTALEASPGGAASDATPWRERCMKWKRRYAVWNEPHRLDEGPVNAYELVEVLNETIPAPATVVTDTGTPFFALGQALKARNGLRYIVSGAFGSMGYALPAGLGICAATPHAPVFCVTGDGSLQMNIQELQTLRHHGMDLRLIILLNDGYLSIRNTQDNFFKGRHVGSSTASGVSLPSLAKIADCYGLPYRECPARSQLRDTLQWVVKTRGPLICGIVSQTDQKIMPAVTAALRPDGTMQSKPPYDMWPFLNQDELNENLNDGAGAPREAAQP